MIFPSVLVQHVIGLTFIFGVGVPDLEDPVLTARLVEGGEPRVGRVAVHARGQQVSVGVSDPGHRQVAEVLDGAGNVSSFALDADDRVAGALHEVRPGEGPGGVGSDVVIQLAKVATRPPGGIS